MLTPEQVAAKIGLVLVRSDTGDGGWSLHTKDQIADAETNGEAPQYVTCGPALATDDNGWSRPDSSDFSLTAEAIADGEHSIVLE